VAQQGRLSARLHKTRQLGPRGLHSLNLDPRRDAWVYVPPSYEPDHPAPLVLALHGAGGKALHHLGYLRPLADEHGLVLLGPTSREDTWDVIRGEYGPDILFIDRSLEETFDSYAIAPGLIAVEGFSDGASYALSIGLANGDLFTHILAFSPGFMAPLVQQGDPRIFISHGASDPVLRIDVCSRRLVPRLELAGYRVRFVEFSGGHTVPQDLAEDAVAWFLHESGPAQQASGDVR
jgi:phospholipase/carboxylesterase